MDAPQRDPWTGEDAVWLIVGLAAMVAIGVLG